MRDAAFRLYFFSCLASAINRRRSVFRLAASTSATPPLTHLPLSTPLPDILHGLAPRLHAAARNGVMGILAA